MHYLVLLGLSLFYGFAFEEFYREELPNRPGGVRTFPLLAFAGAALYLIEPRFALAFVAGLLVLGTWLASYVRADLRIRRDRVEAYFVVPTSILIAYVLGPIALTQPLWLVVAFVVVVVLLIGSRKTLHRLTQRVPSEEMLTLGQFLLLVGVVLPLLYRAPQIPFTHITPLKAWLALIAVSTLSYVSYLLQRYVFPQSGVLLTAILGGLYSSTATTVVLSRKAREEGMNREISGGIVAATGMMYVRIVVIASIFNLALGRMIALPLLVLAVLSVGGALLLVRGGAAAERPAIVPRNPLQLGTAALFAALFIVISLLTNWVQTSVGSSGILGLAAVVGISDIDPFVLSLAQGGAATIGLVTAAVAIVIASSSNNLLKAIYAIAFSRQRTSWLPAAALLFLSCLGLGAAGILAR